MLIFTLFHWWYTSGWKNRWSKIATKTAELVESFSLGILVQTLFKPWKQISALGPKESGLGGAARRLMDSLVSRFVGFWIRLFVLVGGILYICLELIINTTIAITWPVIPLLPIALIVVSMGGL